MASLPVQTISDDPTLVAILATFGAADCCWFSSVRPDGRSHLAPIWHLWQEGQVCVLTQAASVRVANIRSHPYVSLALPDPMNPIIVEGVAAITPDLRTALAPGFLAKYNWDITTDGAYDTVLAVTPRKVMSWGSHGEGRWQIVQA